jgi:hypothetical protein
MTLVFGVSALTTNQSTSPSGEFSLAPGYLRAARVSDTRTRFGYLATWPRKWSRPPPITDRQRRELQRLAARPDSQIDFSDAPEGRPRGRPTSRWDVFTGRPSS